jgi:hypothetical protein
MDPKATKCIFIGWDETTKGFCCYNSMNKKIFIMQHVKINELEILITNINLTKENTSTFDFQWMIRSSFIMSTNIVPFKPSQNINLLYIVTKNYAYINPKLSIIV